VTPADRLDMLAAYGVRVSLTDEGDHLDVEGPVAVIELATPTLSTHRLALLSYLRSCVLLREAA